MMRLKTDRFFVLADHKANIVLFSLKWLLFCFCHADTKQSALQILQANEILFSCQKQRLNNVVHRI